MGGRRGAEGAPGRWWGPPRGRCGAGRGLQRRALSRAGEMSSDDGAVEAMAALYRAPTTVGLVDRTSIGRLCVAGGDRCQRSLSTHWQR